MSMASEVYEMNEDEKAVMDRALRKSVDIVDERFHVQQCSGCGGENKRVPQRYCHDCHAAYMRANRPKYRELTELQKKKDACRSYANAYLRRGLLTPEPCPCGNDDSQMHHEDYDEPLKVVWLCRECHTWLHKVYAVRRLIEIVRKHAHGY